MKKSDYGEIKFSIEIREDAMIIDGPLTVQALDAVSKFSEKLFPSGIYEPTCDDCLNGGITISRKESK